MTRDTDPDELRPVLEAVGTLEATIEHEAATLKKALHSLRDTVLEHYQRMTERGDRQDRRLDRLERHLGLSPLPDEREAPTQPEVP
jgi:hypothetical protein